MSNHGFCSMHFLKAGRIRVVCLLLPASFLLLLSLVFISCGPAIHSFQVDQQTITAADSIKVNWDVSGKPTLVIHENEAAGNEGAGGGSAGDRNGERVGSVGGDGQRQ